tara:strand:+ start:81 stop:884 length:804 start_codon:yes stop_codon:yes gene_type:complete
MEMNKTIFFIFFLLSVVFSIDTDGDGYSDQIELDLGMDPNNIESRYYYGYWPFNPNKEKIKGDEIPINCPLNTGCRCQSNDDCINGNCQRSVRGEYYCTPQVGDTFPHFIAVDQYGESVDIYDFAMQGKLIAVEFGAAWCPPCKDLSNWLSTGDNSITNNRWWKKEYAIIKDKINDGEIIFITILFQNELKDNASYDTVMNWHEKYPNSKIPILADEYSDIHQWIKPTGYPCVNLLDENMKLLNFTGRGLSDAFDILSGLKPIPKIN